MRKILSLCLALALAVSAVPNAALAAEAGVAAPVSEVQEAWEETARGSAETVQAPQEEPLPEKVAEEEAEPAPDDAGLTGADRSEEPAPDLLPEPAAQTQDVSGTRSVVASGTCGDNVTWTLDSSGLMTIAGTGPMQDLYSSGNRPYSAYSEDVKVLKFEEGVTSAGRLGFVGFSNLTTILFADSITHIGTGAFQYASKLSQISFPSNLKYIGGNAFGHCSSLTEVTIPATVNTIGESPFRRCKALTAINVDSGNTGFTSVDGVLFDKQKTKLIGYPTGKTGNYTCPGTVKTIGRFSFTGSTGLTGIDLPTGLTMIESYAFDDCSSLQSITIPGGVTDIQRNVFDGAGLTQITFQGELPTLGEDPEIVADPDSVFLNVTATVMYPPLECWEDEESRQDYGGHLTWVLNDTCGDSATWYQEGNDLYIAGSGDMWDFSSASAQPWYWVRNKINYAEIGSGVTRIGTRAFYEMPELDSVYISPGVKQIGNFAFLRCPDLNTIYVDPANTVFGSEDGVLMNKLRTTLYAYPNAYSSAYVIPDSVTTIKAYAFGNCGGLMSVTIPDSVETVEAYAFNECRNLATVVFQGSAPSALMSYAFCEVTADVLYPADDASWTDSVRQNYGGRLTWIPCSSGNSCGESVWWTLEEGLLSIFGTGAMTDFTRTSPAPWAGRRSEIRYVAVGQGVTRIGNMAFESCPNLTEATLPAGLETIGARAFFQCTSLPRIFIPEDVRSLGDFAFSYCDAMTEFEVGSDSPYFTDIDGVLANKAKTEIICCPGGRFFGFTIPSTVTVIRKDAFFMCSRMTEITMPSGLTTIGNEAFYGCSSVFRLVVPETVTSIGYRAFGQCTCLEAVVFLGSAPTIAADGTFADVTADAFYPEGDATWTESVRQNYGGTITWVAVPMENRIGNTVFWRLAEGVMTVFGSGESWDYPTAYPSFYDRRDEITSVVVEDGVRGLGDYLFYDLLKAEEMTIPASVSSVGAYCICICSSLKKVTFCGEAPRFTDTSFSRSEFTAYYPWGDETWTEEVRRDYDGTVTWVAYLPGGILPVDFAHSASFGNDLAINYYIEADAIPEGATFKLVGEKDVWNADGSSKTVETFEITNYTTGTTAGITEHKFVFKGIAAKQMGDEVRVKLVGEMPGAPGEEPAAFESEWDAYSVADYARSRLEKSTKPFFKTLLVDMLNYGAAAQTYFNYRTNAPVNADLTPAQQALGTQADITNEGVPEAGTAPLSGTPMVLWTGKIAVFGNTIEPKYYFELAEGVSPEDVRLRLQYTSVDGSTKTETLNATDALYDEGNHEYALSFAGVAAKDMGQQVRAWFIDANDQKVSDTILYGLENYFFNRLEKSTDENFKTLIRAVLKYSRSAKAYFQH
ncbi:MAG: leucine-rich repeat protein [Lachnospiraceae bacterium]|nr:leucine-rich repeat protein [Lachnospiraceae bacterium]